jgi:tetratricopeptide (TPR) repeat protein
MVLEMKTTRRAPVTALLGIAGLLLAFGTAAQTPPELVLPPTVYSGTTPPVLLADPDRPADAPTAAAIDAITAEDGAEAGATLAAKALQSSRIAYGPRDARTVIPLINQATARQRAGQTAAALVDYRAAIELAESTGGPRDPRLFDAWYGSGHAHLAAGQVDSAGIAFETALQLHRVNQGLYSAGQLDLLHALASTLRARGQPEDADELQMRRIGVAERVYGLGTPELAQAYIPIGRWFREEGQYDAAISLHAIAVENLGKRNPQDPALIEPLLDLALSGGLRRRGDNGAPPLPGNLQPATVLKRAEAIAEAQYAQDPLQLARTLTRIGDVQLSVTRRDQALRLYRRAATLFTAARQAPHFDEPAFVVFRPPSVAPVEGPGGHVLAEFTVDASGRVKDLRIVQSQPASMPAEIGSRLRQALSEARLRPRIRNGEAVKTEAVRFRLPVRGGSA